MTDELSVHMQKIKEYMDLNKSGDPDKIDSQMERNSVFDYVDQHYDEMDEAEREQVLAMVDTWDKQHEEEPESLAHDQKEKFKAYDNGDSVRYLLKRGKQKGEVTKDVNTYISQTNKDNVLDFLDGYYSDGKNHVEGLMEKMDDDNKDGQIKIENKLKLIDNVLAKAKELGLEDSKNYQEIVTIRNRYTNNDKDFNKTYRKTSYFNMKQGNVSKWGSVGTGFGTGVALGVGAALIFSGPVGWVVGGVCAIGGAAIGLADRITDNEVLDEKLKALYEDMKQRAASQDS